MAQKWQPEEERQKQKKEQKTKRLVGEEEKERE
jgi:hypothetical protein